MADVEVKFRSYIVRIFIFVIGHAGGRSGDNRKGGGGGNRGGHQGSRGGGRGGQQGGQFRQGR